MTNSENADRFDFESILKAADEHMEKLIAQAKMHKPPPPKKPPVQPAGQINPHPGSKFINLDGDFLKQEKKNKSLKFTDWGEPYTSVKPPRPKPPRPHIHPQPPAPPPIRYSAEGAIEMELQPRVVNGLPYYLPRLK